VSARQTPSLWQSPSGVALLRFARSLVVGSGGTALDFAALTVSIRVFGVDATWARVIGLLVGGVVLFFGSRSYAFRAQAESAAPQAKRFVISEIVGFPLNLLAFRLLLWALPAAPPEGLSLLANFALFVTYYYPVRNYVVFKTKEPLVVQAVPSAALKPAVPGAAPKPAVSGSALKPAVT
jgi:putative flippase GtrA